MSFAFKKFNFFQQHEVKLHGFPANSNCYCLGSSLLYVGCDNGTVHLLDEAFQSQGSLNAYGHKVLFMAWAPARQLLVTVGLEEPGISTATLKVWDAERVTAAAANAAAASSAAAAISSLPQPPAASTAAASLPPLRVHKLFSSKHPESEVTALAVTDSGSAGGSSLTLAVGLAAGAVHVFSGDVMSPKGKLHHTGKLQVRPDSSEMWRVNALAFATPPKQQEQQQGTKVTAQKEPAAATAAAAGGGRKIAALGRNSTAASGAPSSGGAGDSSSDLQPAAHPQWLFVVTESQTLAFSMADMSKTILDQQGLLASGCAVMQEGVLVVARDDALYEYTPETRAGCTAFEGVKQGLGKLRRYLHVTTDDTSPDGAASSQLHLLDVRNKLLAGSFCVQGLAAVVVGPGGLATWEKSGRLMRYFEVELNLQLEVLFKRSLHKLALDLAMCHGANPELIAAIRQRWGDHLYAKAEYEGAMAQYLETIGSDLEPSYVIRRFLDAQRIHSLTRYLEQLHACGLGTADHTTLLLNCYTKLKDVEKLDAFLHRNAGSSSSSSRGAAGVVGGGAAGMAVLAAAERAAKRQGKGAQGPQLSFDPETAFKVLRSAGYAQHALFVAEQAEQPEWILDVLLEDLGSYPEALAFIGMLSRRQQAQALQRYGKLLIGAAPDDTTALLMALCMPGPDLQHQPDTSADAKADAKFTASVADYAQLYADRPTRLLYLCEFILFNSSEGDVPSEQQLYHTLLELYLAEQLVDHELQEAAAGSAAEVAPQARRDKARDLLQRGWQPHMAQPKYDPEHALVLCRQHSYVPGLVLLYDKKRLHREVLAVYMEAGDHSSLISACIQYGDAAAGGDPQLWAETLEYFCAQPGDCSAAISQVLQHVERGELLPPLVVLQTLAKNKTLKVSIVKEYVARQLQMEGKEIAKDRDTISRLQAETSAMKAEAVKLKSQPHVFQSSRCAASGQALELPVVHFMCGHSFNLRSLGESDRECPLCAPDFKRVLDIRRNMKAGALRPDEFFSQLDASADGFGVVAEHFGRGIMNMTQQSMASQNVAAGAQAAGLAEL